MLKTGVNMHREYIPILFIAICICVATVYAIVVNWYKMIDIVGVVKPSGASLTSVFIDLGTLPPGQWFSKNVSTFLTCSIKCVITKVVVARPAYDSQWLSMISAFRDFNITFNVGGKSGGILVIVQNGTNYIYTNSPLWNFEFQEGDTAYYSYKLWHPITLQPGEYIVWIRPYGITSIPYNETTFKIAVYLEINPTS